MSPTEYKTYLASREWALLKRRLRERSSDRCERCRHRPYQQTHHVTYERIGHEHLTDLLAVCSPCHEFLSARRDDDPVLSDPVYWFLDVGAGACLSCRTDQPKLWRFKIRSHALDMCDTCFQEMFAWLEQGILAAHDADS